ncbi:antA/AntB antirepressor family protein [Campylobacter coli]|uniref:antA/AntB antirepressor family protein n=1 Tax=Campylobacter coli TaxID=195 RepID=UPI0012F4A0F4|nr:antA/AntB antirepressor family protein [Campylobacter coli]
MTNLIPLRHNNQILARDLHFFIDAKRQFANWINERIENYDFIENQDYAIELVYTKGRPRKEYYITLDMAKELCMVENNEKGRQARRYFIECEKRLKNIEAEQMQKLAFRQNLGYKSQLAQQKEHYENKIKALKYDLEKKKELSFKRKLSKEELLELRKILARDYGMICIKEWEFEFLAEKIALESTKMTTWDAVVKKLKQSLDYWQNYEEYEEKWRKILRR